MKKDALKSNLSLLLLCLASTIVARQPEGQRTKMKLYAELIKKLGPTRAKLFKQRLEQKHRKIDTVKPTPSAPLPPSVTPVESPNVQPTLQTPPPVTIQPPMAPTVPQPKEWITDTEREAVHHVIDQLHLYISHVHNCLNDFFNKNNNEPYRHHVHCFKTQLKFLQHHLQHYPQPQTPAGTLLLNLLKQIALTLEKGQDTMCQALDRDYPHMSLGSVALGMNLKQLETPANQQRALINKYIGDLRNELRKAHAIEILQHTNKLNTIINTLFDYFKNKGINELGPTLIHRVKR